MNRLLVAAIALSGAFVASYANAQSFNIEFGHPGSAPASSYGAAGLTGTWNTFGVLSSSPQTIVTLQGLNIGATIKNIGGTAIISSNDANTSAGDEALMDDMLISLCNPLDACLFVAGVPNGDYEVIIYAKTPGSASTNNVRVDFADQGNQVVGGTWPGGHVEGTTFARFTITTNNNKIDFHSGVPSSSIQSGLNGVQIRRLIDGDFNGDGLVNFRDRTRFCSMLGLQEGQPGFDLYADFNDDGVIDHLDQAEFNDLLPLCVGDVVNSNTFLPPADGMIDGADLAILLGDWGNQASCSDYVNSRTFLPPPDGKVDGADLAVLLGAWGGCD